MKINSFSNVLKLAAAISVLAFLSHVQAEGEHEAYGYASHPGDAVPLINYATRPEAQCGSKEEIINTFKDKYLICFNTELWKSPSRIREELPKLLDGANGNHLYVLFYYINRFSGRPHRADYVITNERNWQRFLDLFTRKSLETLPNDEQAAIVLANMMPRMKPEQTQYLNTNNIKSALYAIEDAHYARLALNSLHPTVAKAMIDDIAEFLGRHSVGQLVHFGGLSEAILKNLLTEDYCSKVQAGSMLSLGERRKQASLITSACMGELSWENTPCDRRIRAFPPESFKLSRGNMHESCLELLTRRMVEEYGVGLDGGDRCAQLAIEKLSDPAIRGVTSKCLIERLSGGELEGPFKLGGRWTLLPVDIFSQLKGSEEVLKVIEEEDFGKMTLEQKSYITQITEACEHLQPYFFLENGDISITQECFDKLNPDAKAAAVIHATLPDMALSKVTSLKEWHLPRGSIGAEDSLEEGIGILEYIRKPNAGKLIFNLSADEPDNHACQEIESLEMLAKMPFFQEHCSEACIKKALSEKITLARLKEVSARVANMIPLEDLLEGMSSSDWQNLEIEDFRKVLSNPEFCKGMKAEQLNAFNKPCLEAIDSTCAAAITIWDEVQESVVRNMKPETFHKFTGLLASAVGIEKLSDAQFAELGAETPPEHHPAAIWSKEFIASLKPGRAAVIKGDTWKLVRPEAFEGLTAEQMQAIKPENMVHWSAKQVAMVPKDRWSALPPKQADKIGSAAPDVGELLTYLADAPLSEKSLAAIKGRQQPAPQAAEEKKEAEGKDEGAKKEKGEAEPKAKTS